MISDPENTLKRMFCKKKIFFENFRRPEARPREGGGSNSKIFAMGNSVQCQEAIFVCFEEKIFLKKIMMVGGP